MRNNNSQPDSIDGAIEEWIRDTGQNRPSTPEEKLLDRAERGQTFTGIGGYDDITNELNLAKEDARLDAIRKALESIGVNETNGIDLMDVGPFDQRVNDTNPTEGGVFGANIYESSFKVISTPSQTLKID